MEVSEEEFLRKLKELLAWEKELLRAAYEAHLSGDMELRIFYHEVAREIHRYIMFLVRTFSARKDR